MQLGGSSKILSSIKYIYLIFFFALLSGIFYPIITHTSGGQVIEGVFILFIGLAGALLLFKAGTSDRNQKAYLIAGFAILSIALLLIYAAIGRL